MKNDEFCRFAAQSADIAGEKRPGAPKKPIQSLTRNRDLEARVEELVRIGERCSNLLAEGPTAVEHGELLYDDQGLPK